MESKSNISEYEDISNDDATSSQIVQSTIENVNKKDLESVVSKITPLDFNQNYFDNYTNIKKYDILNKIISDSNYKDNSKDHRLAFFIHVIGGLVADNKMNNDISNKNDSMLVTKRQLLGNKYEEYYDNAIREEYNDYNFIRAVINNSIIEESLENNQTLNKKLVMWVGGPSASGKTFSSKLALKKLLKELSEKRPELFNNNKNNKMYFIQIDGSIERETSIVRKLLLQVALDKGWRGIVDIDDVQGVTKIKDVIQQNLKNNYDFHMIIPETFAGDIPFATKIPIVRNLVDNATNDIKQYAEDNKILQVFSLVQAKESFEQQFKEVVRFSGESRAFRPKNKVNVLSQQDIIAHLNNINNIILDVESKKYNPAFFNLGVQNSLKAKSLYKKYCNEYSKTPITIDIYSKRKLYQLKDNIWNECDMNCNINLDTIIATQEQFDKLTTPDKINEFNNLYDNNIEKFRELSQPDIVIEIGTFDPLDVNTIISPTCNALYEKTGKREDFINGLSQLYGWDIKLMEEACSKMTVDDIKNRFEELLQKGLKSNKKTLFITQDCYNSLISGNKDINQQCNVDKTDSLGRKIGLTDEMIMKILHQINLNEKEYPFNIKYLNKSGDVIHKIIKINGELNGLDLLNEIKNEIKQSASNEEIAFLDVLINEYTKSDIKKTGGGDDKKPLGFFWNILNKDLKIKNLWDLFANRKIDLTETKNQLPLHQKLAALEPKKTTSPVFEAPQELPPPPPPRDDENDEDGYEVPPPVPSRDEEVKVDETLKLVNINKYYIDQLMELQKAIEKIPDSLKSNEWKKECDALKIREICKNENSGVSQDINIINKNKELLIQQQKLQEAPEKLLKEIQEKTKLIEEYKNKLNKMDSDFSLQTISYSSSKVENENLKYDQKNIEKQLEDFKRKLKEKENQITELAKENKELTDVSNKYKEVNISIDSLLNDISKNTNNSIELDKKITLIKSLIKEYQQNINNRKQEIDNFRNVNIDLTTKLTVLNSTLEEMDQQFTNLQEKNNNLIKEIEGTNALYEDADKQLGNLLNNIKDLNNENDSLKAKSKELEIFIESLQNKINQQNIDSNEIQKLKNEINNKQQEIDKIRFILNIDDDNQNILNVIEQLHTKLKEQTENNTKLQQTLNTQQKYINESKTEMDEKINQYKETAARTQANLFEQNEDVKKYINIIKTQHDVIVKFNEVLSKISTLHYEPPKVTQPQVNEQVTERVNEPQNESRPQEL